MIEMPVVKDDDVLIKVYAASVNWLDWHFLTGTPFLARIMAGLLKPTNKVLGIDLAGRVEAVGANRWFSCDKGIRPRTASLWIWYIRLSKYYAESRSFTPNWRVPRLMKNTAAEA